MKELPYLLTIRPQDMLHAGMGLVPVDRAHTLAEFIDLIRQRAAQTPASTWIQTSAAWHEVNLAEGRLPTAPELDEATREHPVVVRRSEERRAGKEGRCERRR